MILNKKNKFPYLPILIILLLLISLFFGKNKIELIWKIHPKLNNKYINVRKYINNDKKLIFFTLTSHNKNIYESIEIINGKYSKINTPINTKNAAKFISNISINNNFIPYKNILKKEKNTFDYNFSNCYQYKNIRIFRKYSKNLESNDVCIYIYSETNNKLIYSVETEYYFDNNFPKILNDILAIPIIENNKIKILFINVLNGKNINKYDFCELSFNKLLREPVVINNRFFLIYNNTSIALYRL